MCDSLKVKFISSLEKCFLDEKFEEKPELKSISMLNNCLLYTSRRFAVAVVA